MYIAKMQTKAVIRAAINVKKAHPDWDIEPEIMIPLVCEIKELKFVKKMVLLRQQLFHLVLLQVCLKP